MNLIRALLGPTVGERVEGLRDKLRVRHGRADRGKELADARHMILVYTINLSDLVARNVATLDDPECLEALHLARNIYKTLKQYRALRARA